MGGPSLLSEEVQKKPYTATCAKNQIDVAQHVADKGYFISSDWSPVVVTGGSFCKGVRVPIGVPGGRVCIRAQVGGGGGLPVGKEGKREGGEGGGGVGRRQAKSMRTRLSEKATF